MLHGFWSLAFSKYVEKLQSEVLKIHYRNLEKFIRLYTLILIKKINFNFKSMNINVGLK